MEDNYTKLKNEIYKIGAQIQSIMSHKKWIKSTGYGCISRLDQVCRDIDTSNKKERQPTRVTAYGYGFEIAVPNNSGKITNTCMRYEDILNIEHDHDISTLFVLFRSNNNAQHYVYPDVPKEDYDLLKERYLDMK